MISNITSYNNKQIFFKNASKNKNAGYDRFAENKGHLDYNPTKYSTYSTLKKGALLLTMLLGSLTIYKSIKVLKIKHAKKQLTKIFKSDSDKQILSFITEKQKVEALSSIPNSEKIQLFKKLQCLQPLKEEALAKAGLSTKNIYLKLSSDLSFMIKPSKSAKSLSTTVLKNFYNGLWGIEKSIKQLNFNKFKKGLPLKYSRNKFIEDVNSITKDFTATHKETIFKKYGFYIYSSKNKLKMKGFPEIKENANPLISDIPKAKIKQIEGKIKAFTIFNKINTGDSNLDKDLNSIIKAMPDFFAIIAKKQHRTHKYSLDIHMLKALKELTGDPNYKKLSDKNKTIAKISILIHDIAKSEGIPDKAHAIKSAIKSLDITAKLNLNEADRERVYDLIENHHWLEEYKQYKSTDKISKTLAKFKTKEDFEIQKMLAKADLKAVNSYLYYLYSGDYWLAVKKTDVHIKQSSSTCIIKSRIGTPLYKKCTEV